MRWQSLDERIASFDGEFAEELKRDEAARRLTSIPGIGALNATALVAAVGHAPTFARGRNLAVWLGLRHNVRVASKRYLTPRMVGFRYQPVTDVRGWLRKMA